MGSTELARTDQVLGPITTHPQFDRFAQEFFEELHSVDEGEPPAGTA